MGPRSEVITTLSEEETEAAGERAGRLAERGMVFGLSGDLGAGKTAWVRGFAKGLNFPGLVHSPTYALINFYLGGRHPLFHLDLYRLTSRDDVFGAGLEEYLVRPDGVTVAEWIERWQEQTPSYPEPGAPIQVRITTCGESCRQIEYAYPRS
jgi:tRNA threonylcarbamoyladenosine biosynthesis protein TsaE